MLNPNVMARSATAKPPVIRRTRVRSRMGEDTLNKDNPVVIDLERVYRETLRNCGPDTLVAKVAARDMPRHVVAIGKCAGLMVDGFASVVPIESAFVVLPHGYPPPKDAGGAVGAPLVMYGGHPQMDADSFRAGEALLRYVDAHDEITFLISGGGSACVDVALHPFTG